MDTTTITRRGKQMLLAFAPSKVVQSRLHKRVMMNFAERAGLVYFGYVDQRDDEHRLVRGLTISPHHRDNHYCIGTFQGYDVVLVERTDTIKFPGKSAKMHDWIIMEFDLHTKWDIPHIFLGLHSHSDTFYAQLFTKFSKLARMPQSTLGVYSQAFASRYAVYTEPERAIEVEELFDKKITETIGQHFGSLTVEVSEGCLYLYAEHQRPSQALLDKMIKYGTWLAESIDMKMQ
jgi:hypothetical protein